jgi:hypothetical protein
VFPHRPGAMFPDGCGVVLGLTDHAHLGFLSGCRGHQWTMGQTDQRPLRQLRSTIVAPLFRPAHPRPDWKIGRSSSPGRSLALYTTMCGTCVICVSCLEVGDGLEGVCMAEVAEHLAASGAPSRCLAIVVAARPGCWFLPSTAQPLWWRC